MALSPDGSELWSLASSATSLGAVVGDRIVVTIDRDPSAVALAETGVVLRAYGNVVDA